MEFRWNKANTEHIANHGVSPDEAERVVRNARRPHPLLRDDDKWLVWGRGHGGRLLQVVFILDEDNGIYVIHARPLTENEKRRFRRRESQ
ncbi:MAG: BrnT family toxin [Phycisphaerae bacterium]